MAKLYLFGMGGTGARVIKSLIFMLAAGVRLSPKIDTVIPVITDPDNGNGDLTRTKELLELYMKINKRARKDQGFFGTRIKNLTELTNSPSGLIGDKFKMLDISEAQNEKFREFIGYGSLSSETRSLMDLLFSEENLNADMTVGFKGNPNIGSVVLNQFKNSREYPIFLRSFEPGDSIFIISSIFGGTGAAGFPLLLRNLRKPDPDLPNSDKVANAKIGALSMLPYFKITEPEDKAKKTIDSSSFMGKAKAALSFYLKSIFGKNRQLNAFYTLGEDAANFYEHNDGQADQKNNAHFLELAAALGVVDFSWTLNDLETNNGMANDTIFKEFGVKSDTRSLNINSLGDKSKDQLFKPLAKFTLMVLFQEYVLENKSNFEKSPWHIDLQNVYSHDGLYNRHLKEFADQYRTWLQEMKDSDVQFEPFRVDPSYSKLLSFIIDYEVKENKLKFWDNPAHGDKFNKMLNVEFKQSNKTDDKGRDFIHLFNEATEKQINSILKIDRNGKGF